MFFPNSRYLAAGTYTIRTARGDTVTVTRLPVRARPPVRSLHQRLEGQRLDLVASHYLGDATTFWRLCDASDAIAPDALGVRARIAIPDGGG